MKIHFNSADYPYDYKLEIWKNFGTGTCFYYIREVVDTTTQHFDQFLSIGQTLRLIHTGNADTNYTWHDIDFFSGGEFQKKFVLVMRWEELADSGLMLPIELNITFPEKQIN
jgi:hypothetical protein